MEYINKEIIGKEITGEEFNKIITDTFYKFTNSEENHYEYQYKTGLNIDTNEFDISNGECNKGGLYFTSKKHFIEWMGKK